MTLRSGSGGANSSAGRSLNVSAVDFAPSPTPPTRGRQRIARSSPPTTDNASIDSSRTLRGRWSSSNIPGSASSPVAAGTPPRWWGSTEDAARPVARWDPRGSSSGDGCVDGGGGVGGGGGGTVVLTSTPRALAAGPGGRACGTGTD